MEKITLGHGSGGQATSELIDSVFKKYLSNPYFTADDAAVLPRSDQRLAMSTDGFIVDPFIFPGGNIGKLSVCGTVNDLSCMGAKPTYMTCSFIIEEGLPMDDLITCVKAMGETASEVGVHIVAGDTKVAGRGQVDHLFITTTGVGYIDEGVSTSGAYAKAGDVVIVTGDIGRHGTAILLARDDYGIEANVTSDCAPLWQSVQATLDVTHDIHTIRDATRGGVGTVLYEIARESQVGIRLDATKIPVAPNVRGVTGMLGLDPLYLACEGRLVYIVPKKQEEAVLNALRKQKYTADATTIGEVVADHVGHVTITTEIGGETLLPPPGNELLPRIC